MAAWRSSLWLLAVWLAAAAAWQGHQELAARPGAVPNCDALVQAFDDGHSQFVCRKSLANVPSLAATPLQHGDAVERHDGRWQRRAAGMQPEARQSLGLPVAINCVSAKVLARIDGIPAKTAAALVAYRDAHGPFWTAESLLQVSGVGPKRAAKLLAASDFAYPCSWPDGHKKAIQADVRREWLVDLVAWLPQGLLSRLWGWLARCERPQFLVRALQRSFASNVGIDMAEAEHPLEAYPSLQALFTRALRPGLRPIPDDPSLLLSPVDAHVGEVGTVTEGTLLQIKGRTYSLARLLGDHEKALAFEGGAYATFYLAPRDYHRVHAPAAGHVVAAQVIPGLLMPVFAESLAKVDELFARNERIITYLRSVDAGELAVVKVGATLVGAITTTYDGQLRGNVANQRSPQAVRFERPPWLERGDWLGTFELGSTVVLLAQPGKVSLDPLAWGSAVRMGQRIGVALKAPRERDLGAAPSVVWRPDDDEP